MGHRFLEHTLLLNDVLLGLVLQLRLGETAPLGELPFRWFCETDEVLEYRALGRHVGESFQAVLKPDAIMEVPSAQRRLFLEAETGTQSIVTAHPERTGAIVAKLQRYSQYFEGFREPQGPTFCERAFPDGMAPRLVFLVHSVDRRQRVQKAVDEQLRRSPGRFKVLVLTFGEAASKISGYFPDRLAAVRAAKAQATAMPGQAGTKPAGGPRAAPPASPPPAPAPRFALAVDERDLRLLRDSYRRMDKALEDAYEAIDEHQKKTRCFLDVDRLPRHDLDFLRKIILGDQKAAAATAPAG